MLAIRQTPDEAPARVEVTLEEICSTPGPAVFLVGESSLELFQTEPLRFASRGSKHPRRDLASYLLNGKQPRIPVLRAAFDGPANWKRSVGALMSRIRKAGLRTVAVVAVGEDLFSALAGSSPKAAPGELRFRDLFHYDPREQELAHLVNGNSLAIVDVRLKILKAAAGRFPVLITGPTGSGKTHIAKIIHDQNASEGNRGRFVEINCASIPSQLLESELFGHRAGAYTGALRDRMGLWEDAGQGTIFLDEVGDLRLEHQAKVLQALNSGKIRRLGDTAERSVSARVIAATNRPLELLLRDSTFREDLYFRLAGFNIDLPALDRHPEDIPLLARKFWETIAPNAPGLGEEAVQFLRSVRWPGNIRMLRRCLEVVYGLIAPGTAPAARQFEYVLRAFSPVLPDPQTGDRDRTAVIHLSNCILHLRRLEAALARLSRAVNAKRRAERRAEIESVIGELETLAKSPWMFHSRELAKENRLLVVDLVQWKSRSRGSIGVELKNNIARLERHAGRELLASIEELSGA